MKTLILIVALLFLNGAFAFNEVVNGEEIRQRIGTFNISRDLSNLKVAVLDNGFRGFVREKGMLPASAEYIEGVLKLPETTSHGLGMAQIVWEATGKNAAGPKFYLINANGFTNFKAAVDFVIKNKIDIVLYSQVWTFGSNFDGKGFISGVVNRAVDAGVVWINAAGNLGGQVFNGDSNSDERIELTNKLDENSVTLTLTWNDFSENEETCTLKDLDLEVYDAQGGLVGSGALLQSGSSPDPKDPSDKRTCYARETLNLRDLNRGSYFARVINKTHTDVHYRLIMTETQIGSLEFAQNRGGLEIMPPADNPRVLTVGEKTPFGAMGPTSDGRMKPDVLVENAQVVFSNGAQTAGTSNAAAMVAGAVTLMKSAERNLSGSNLISYAQSLRAKVVIPAGLVKPQAVSNWVQSLVPPRGVVRQDPGTYRLVVLSYEKPTELPSLRRFNLRMNDKYDIVACLENMSMCRVFPMEQDYDIKPPFIEFRQYQNAGLSDGPGLWKMP